MIKFVYKNNNVYLDKYIVIEDVEPKTDFDNMVLNASIIENNHFLNKYFKGYKIVDLEFKEDENLYYIKMYNKRYDIKRVEKICIWFFAYRIGLSL